MQRCYRFIDGLIKVEHFKPISRLEMNNNKTSSGITLSTIQRKNRLLRLISTQKRKLNKYLEMLQCYLCNKIYCNTKRGIQNISLKLL